MTIVDGIESSREERNSTTSTTNTDARKNGGGVVASPGTSSSSSTDVYMEASTGRQLQSLKSQAKRLPFLLLACSIVLAVALNVTNSRMPDPKKARPLPDVGFDILAKEPVEHVTDALLWILNLTIVLVVWKLFVLHRKTVGLPNFTFGGDHPVAKFFTDVWSRRTVGWGSVENNHLIAWVRFWSTYAIVLLFRSFVIVATVLPATDNKCQHPKTIENPYKNVFLAIVTFGGSSIHCGDLLFSGHTVSIALSFMTIWTYGNILHWIFRPIAAVVTVGTWYTIIASRSHYTDDIAVAFYVTVATYLVIRHTHRGVPYSIQCMITCPCEYSAILAAQQEEEEVQERSAQSSRSEHGGGSQAETLSRDPDDDDQERLTVVTSSARGPNNSPRNGNVHGVNNESDSVRSSHALVNYGQEEELHPRNGVSREE